MAATPVLVTAYNSGRATSFGARNARGNSAKALPPISSFAFADILRSADCADFQLAIDGIAEICAKNRMSLADEYGSHLPPLGEITAASSAAVRPHLLRPGMRRALTSVPEGSSGSSEGSHESKKKRSGLFGFRKRHDEQSQAERKIRIGSMGRTISISGTTAMADSIGSIQDADSIARISTDNGAAQRRSQPMEQRSSEAASSLQRLLAQKRSSPSE